MLYRRAIYPALVRLGGGDPETAHERVLAALALVSRSPALTRALDIMMSLGQPDTSSLARKVFGMRFPHPVGLAAGFDKNGVALHALAALGFGFIEAGTITRVAQPGNPRPRLFRLLQDQALINRMGFNNEGAEAVAARLKQTRPLPVPLGLSLGKSKITPLEEAAADYLASLDTLYPYGDYFAVNISSPNTPGLRELQESDRLDTLLEVLIQRLRERAIQEERATPKPLLVKVAPDLDEAALERIVEACLARGASGLVAVNTTLDRSGLRTDTPLELRDQPGGLSGRPLHARAVEVVRFLSEHAGDQLPIVGCGGIFTANDAKRMLDVGASLLQLYTGFIYQGPAIARQIAHGLLVERQAPTNG
ncbi:MAG TPA: quinone-dependent dihydroorotate dehydrogenase [Ktedonobacterales bacterium]|nr:quinone-dependent dihydroorotate dehydrogenase [Ktedonobacterales bacterium]